jgi:hypothetical protein
MGYIRRLQGFRGAVSISSLFVNRMKLNVWAFLIKLLNRPTTGGVTPAARLTAVADLANA